MARLTISSPGIEIREIDLSQRPSIPSGTNVFFTGFTSQGPTDQILILTSLSEFETIFGKPYTAAERYSYHTMKALSDSSANIFFSRLPYGGDNGDIFTNEKYSALVYPAIPDDGETALSAIESSGVDPLSADNFYLTKPYHLELTNEQYESLINDEVSWESVLGKSVDFTDFANIGNAALVILNTSQTVINNSFEGYYVGLSDNRNTDPASPYLDVTTVNTVNNNESTSDYIEIPTERLDFKLSSVNDSDDSLSEVLEGIPTFDIGTSEFKDTLSLGVFKLTKNPFAKDAVSLTYTLAEGYFGSLDRDREIQSQTGGQNRKFFLENVDDESPNLRVFVNPNLSKAFNLDLSGNPKKSIRVLDHNSLTLTPHLSSDLNEVEFSNELYPLGVYSEGTDTSKEIGSIPAKLQRVMDLAENPEIFPIDISVEGGLGTIFASTQELTSYSTYNETVNWPSLSGIYSQEETLSDPRTVSNYITVFNMFENYARSRRKDHMFIADPIRHIFIHGKNTKVEKQKTKNFSQHIYWPLRNQFKPANTSYSTTYANWVKVYDSNADEQIWVPYSGFAAGLMAQNDPWDAPAGFTRGVNRNISDIAFGATNQKQRDQLYKINLNPIFYSPSDGYVTYGQKTLQTKPSAFDRINVRRTFLFLEKATKNTLKYFVFEPNTLFTRTQVINTLTPIFDLVKNEQGVYDYRIICDERNNTPDVIDQNQLIVDIYLQPVRTAEFILCNFYATRTGVNFDELI